MSNPSTDTSAPNCRLCGNGVASWHPDHPEQAICMDCCGDADHEDGEHGHQYYYERGEGYMCNYCGAPATDDWLIDRATP